jgi:GNAT superfamily N-acetyltransferase
VDIVGGVSVLPDERRRGLGNALFAHVVDHARSLGKQDLETIAFADDPEGIAFAERRGFVVIARNRSLRLDLSDCQVPDVALPADVSVTTLGERPELDVALWEIACESIPDIPFDGDVPLHPGTLDEFRASDLADPRALPDATFVALEDGVAVGYAQLAWDDPARGIAVHRMLAVRRSHRGRGIAAALKARQIAWAVEHGLTELRTANEDRNVAARAVNARFPYVPIPDQLILRGPLPPEG